MLQIRWRRWLTERYSRDWLAGRAYYLLQLEPSRVENPEQRIQDDIGIVTSLTLDLLTGVLNSLATLGSFVVLLWLLSGTLPLRLPGVSVVIPGYMVWVAILYAALGSVATHLVGRALIGINFDLQRYDAEFRFRMIRIRENAEGVALSGGEADEELQLKAAFGNIWRTWWRLMKAQRRLTFFSAGYGQVATIFPIIVAAPRYFAGVLTLGGLTQTALAFGQVQSSLSWFVDAYPRIAQWTASVNRLTGFDDALRRVQQLAKSAAALGVTPSPTSTLIVEDMQLSLPDRRSILDHVSVSIDAGDRVVVSGPSGSGKSTLLRARLRLPTRLVVPGRGHFGRGRGNGGGALRPAPGAATGTHHDLDRPPRHRGEVSSPTTDTPSRDPLDRGRRGVTSPLLWPRNRFWRVSYDSLAGAGCGDLRTHRVPGNARWKVAPCSGFAVAQSRPLWLSTIERLIDSPMPSPPGFVV